MISKEIKDLIGKEFIEPSCLQVEKGMIQRFVEAIDDDNPLWRDERYAKGTKFGEIIAPPTFLTFTVFWPDRIQDLLAKLDSPLKRIMAGGVQYKYFKEVKVGDRITATASIADAQVRDGKKGKLLFITVEVIYKNQNGEIVVKERNTVIKY